MLQEQTQTRVPYLQATLLPALENEILELDEVWTFVGNKAEQVWIWIAQCRRTRPGAPWADRLALRATG